MEDAWVCFTLAAVGEGLLGEDPGREDIECRQAL